MPGTVSDALDPEWGTAETADLIRSMLHSTYGVVSAVLGHVAPIYAGELARTELPTVITATLTERQWRIIRFALERAGESI